MAARNYDRKLEMNGPCPLNPCPAPVPAKFPIPIPWIPMEPAPNRRPSPTLRPGGGNAGDTLRRVNRRRQPPPPHSASQRSPRTGAQRALRRRWRLRRFQLRASQRESGRSLSVGLADGRSGHEHHGREVSGRDRLRNHRARAIGPPCGRHRIRVRRGYGRPLNNHPRKERGRRIPDRTIKSLQ